MTKVTKTEKILRKATSKWEKFLAEGAFKKTLNESMDFRKAHFAAEMEPEELELLNIPEEEYRTKSKEEVEAIAAALDKAHKESQLGVIIRYPKTATYDENEPILRLIDKKRKATRAITGEKGYVHYSDEESKEWADSYSNDMPSDHHEQKEPSVNEMTMGERGMVDAQDGNPPSKIGGGNEEYMAAFNAVMKKMGKEPLPIVKPDQRYLDALRRGNLEENEKKKFEVGEFVYIVNGSLKGASGKILEPVTTSTGEEGFAIELYSDAKMKVFGQRGDEVIALAGDLESGGTSDDMELYDIDEALIKETVRKILSSKKKVKAIKENNPSSFSMRTTHSSDPEMDQVMDIAADMLEMPTRSRGTITLKSVQSALDARSIDSVIENDMLIIDNKYVIAKKELLPKTAQKISFTKYAADYLSNLQGEQQNLPMEEEQARTTMSSDPEMDQIEDIALTVIEKFGGLMSIGNALQDQGFDASISNGALNIDGKYFMGKAENFDISPEEEVRKVGKYVLGYMG